MNHTDREIQGSCIVALVLALLLLFGAPGVAYGAFAGAEAAMLGAEGELDYGDVAISGAIAAVVTTVVLAVIVFLWAGAGRRYVRRHPETHRGSGFADAAEKLVAIAVVVDLAVTALFFAHYSNLDKIQRISADALPAAASALVEQGERDQGPVQRDPHPGSALAPRTVCEGIDALLQNQDLAGYLRDDLLRELARQGAGAEDAAFAAAAREFELSITAQPDPDDVERATERLAGECDRVGSPLSAG